MRFFRRNRKSVLPPAPNELSLALGRWIDGNKRRLADALSRHEQRMTLRQKKFALALFCGVTTGLFIFDIYHGLSHHRSATIRHGDYIHMPAELPLPVPRTKKNPQSLSDSTRQIPPSDSNH